MTLRLPILAAAALALALAAALPPDGASAEAAWTEVDLKMQPSVEFKFRTPRDGADAAGSTVRGNWIDVSGGTTPLKGVKGGRIRFEPRKALIAVDLDGDGQFEGAAKQDVFTAKTLHGDVQAAYAFRLRRDLEKWFFQRACMVVGEIDKVPVAFVDDDNDGSYDDIGKDVVRVGSAAGAGYLARLLPVKGQLYEIEVNAAGTKLRYRKHEAEGDAAPGTLDLFSRCQVKVKPSIAIVKKVGAEDLYFECAVKGGVPVPPGEYVLHEALMGPTRDQLCYATQGRSNPIVVEPGKATVFEWGCPGSIDFSAAKEGNRLTVKGGDAIVVYGRGGEKYEKFEPVGIRIHAEIVDEHSKAKVWYGPVEHLSRGFSVPAKGPWLVRLVNDNVPYLGPFASAWQ